MGTISYTIPVAGSTSFSIAAGEVDTALQTLLTLVNGNVDGANMPASLTGRRLIMQASLLVGAGVTASTYFPTAAGGNVIQAGSTTQPPIWEYLDSANYAVTGKANTQVVLRMSVGANATSASQNFVGQIVPISFSGATGGSVTVTGGVQVGATSAVMPTASTATVIETAPLSFPTAGAYALGLLVGGTTAANSTTVATLQLFVLNS